MTATVKKEQAWAERLAGWRKKFRDYRQPPDEEAIDAWISRFDDADKPVAAKVLDHVKVVGLDEIMQGYRDALNSLPGWHRNSAKWTGRWYFVGFGRPQESGAAMVRLFCEANNLAYDRYTKYFVNSTDLAELRLTASDHVVFIDDFSGSGRQVTRMWPVLSELVGSEARCYLIMTALTHQAQQAIQAETELQIVARYILGPEHALFDPANETFSDDEKITVERYCAIADPKKPRGYGSLGVMYVLQHKTANNCLPVLYVNEPHWRGILPRYWRAAA